MAASFTKFIVITGIHGETEAVKMWQKLPEWHVVLVGDKKSKKVASSDTLTYLSIDDQRDLGFAYTEHCPENNYARKNIGYLYALKQGATDIYDTDDDNLPLEGWERPQWTCSRRCDSASGFANVYRYFSDAFVWPRGFPLDHVHDDVAPLQNASATIGVWQSLADRQPDVDALHRLLFPGDVHFHVGERMALAPRTYCPFNSQCTFWHRDSFAFLYLPAQVSFRFTDILRGYIAQRLLWEQGSALGFTEAMVVQDRNEHDLMNDLRQEMDCYVGVHPTIAALEEAEFTKDPFENVERAYAALISAGVVPKDEMVACRAWIKDAAANR